MKPIIFAIHNWIETVHPAGDGELRKSQSPSPAPVYVFDLVLTHRVRQIFRPPNTPFSSHQLGTSLSTHVPRRSLSSFLSSLLLLYSAFLNPALMSRSSGRSCARSRHSSCPSSGDASPSAVLLILHPTSPSYIEIHFLTGSLAETDRSPLPLSVLRVLVVRYSGYLRDGLRWGRAIYPCLYSWCKTHYLYYFRPR